jgi:hypothetical protein
MDVHNVWIYEFRDGELRRGRVYADTAVLRDTVEASPPPERGMDWCQTRPVTVLWEPGVVVWRW